VSKIAPDKAKYAEDAVNEYVDKMFGGAKKLTYNLWKTHENHIFAIMSEVMNVTIPNHIKQDEFIKEYAEFKSVPEGDSNEFVIPDATKLVVSRFSGGHWNIDRQKFQGKKVVSIPTQWYGVRMYEEWDRVIRGYSTVGEMFNKISESVADQISQNIYVAFNNTGSYLPGDFKVTGAFDKDLLLELADRVMAQTGKRAKIVGTRPGLSLISDGIGDGWVSQRMADERNATGVTRFWEGIPTVVLPQALISGTYDFRIDPKVVRVVPDGYKPIKVLYEGDPRIRSLEPKDNEDQTYEVQTQIKVGVAVVMPELFGEYTIQ
jgi:hypothetical protein